MAALSVAVLSGLLQGTRRTYPGFSRWTAGNACVGLSLVVLSLRGLVPDLVSVAGTNLAAFAGVVLLLEGIREFQGLPSTVWPARILAALSLLAQVYFLVGVNNLVARILLASLCLGVVTAASAVTLFRGMSPGRRLGFVFAGSFFLLSAASNFIRGIATWLGTAPDIFSSTLVNQVYFGGTTIAVIGWGFGFILLTKDRLVADLTAAEHHMAALNLELEEATERAMAAALQAAQADKAKTEFLAYMGHEIRNPLSGVIALNELVLDGPLTEKKRPDLELMQRSTASLVGIMNDILDLSKIEAGHMSVTLAPFDLESELTQIVDLFRPQARARSTTLRLAYPLDLPRWFQGDGARVHQIVSNFTSNAVQFTEGGGIEIRVEARLDGVRISVCDTGIGIAPQTLPLLFEKFIQADASVPRRKRGTGLGLAISKQLAELMGGSVGATSDEGWGSTFSVDLPLKPVDNQGQTEAHAEKSREFGLAGARVLLAEDNCFSQTAMVKLLEKHGMAVDAVDNGRDALAHYGETKYAVVLMDCQMPEMDGYEATRKIRELERSHGGHTPIIAVTAHGMTGERNRCRAAGMDDCLVKPVAPAALVECIAAHLVR